MFVAVGWALFHSTLVEPVVISVFTSITSNFHVTLPISGIMVVSIMVIAQLHDKYIRKIDTFETPETWIEKMIKKRLLKL